MFDDFNIRNEAAMIQVVEAKKATMPTERVGTPSNDTLSHTDSLNVEQGYLRNKGWIKSLDLLVQEHQQAGANKVLGEAPPEPAPNVPPPVTAEDIASGKVKPTAEDKAYTKSMASIGRNYDEMDTGHQALVRDNITSGVAPSDTIRNIQSAAGVPEEEVDGKLGRISMMYLNENTILHNEKDKNRFTLYGQDAITAVEEGEGSLSKAQKFVVKEEAFVSRIYKDTKGIQTYGVGQTGKHIKKNGFKEAYKAHEDILKDIVPNYKNENEEMQGALMSLMYRGDVVRHYNWIEHLNAGEYKQAAIALLDNNDYRKSRDRKDKAGKSNPGGVYYRFNRAAEIIKKQKFKGE